VDPALGDFSQVLYALGCFIFTCVLDLTLKVDLQATADAPYDVSADLRQNTVLHYSLCSYSTLCTLVTVPYISDKLVYCKAKRWYSGYGAPCACIHDVRRSRVFARRAPLFALR